MVEQALARTDDVVNFLPFFVGLLQVAVKYRPALIHANNEPLCNRAALLIGRLLRIPVVCHVRGDQQGGRLLRFLYGLPDHYIAVSNWISDGIGGMGVAPEKRTVIYDGIELHKLDVRADGKAFRARFGISDNAFAVGLVGLLIPWKGQKLFLEAARELLTRIPRLHLLIVGGTPDECADYEKELRRIAGDAPFAGRVTFTGHVAEMAAAYNGLDVVLSASTSPEPLGTVVIESLALGRPLVAPDHGGALEMIEHERTGLLFRANDPASLAAVIERLHAEPDLGRRLGTLARARALETFAVETHASRVQEVYESLLARHQVASTASLDGPGRRALP
jgi:glycosyltransferase involved in cell wall biosynthesis